ncbi:hypothetical protein RSAG8_00327, partial [Rhizoctonia solani AG-8 WAC10335]
MRPLCVLIELTFYMAKPCHQERTRATWHVASCCIKPIDQTKFGGL